MTIESAAFEYASIGWRIIPLYWVTERGVCSCRKGRECPYPAKHPIIEGWPEKATDDRDTIHNWWARWRKANVGLVTGHQFDVLDIDAIEGSNALTKLATKNGAVFPDCWRDGPMSQTSKGHHLWYQATGLKNRHGFLSKVDWKGMGGFVVAPPSVHQSGHVYRWVNNHGTEIPIESAPEFLVAAVRKPREPSSAPLTITNYSPTVGAYNPTGLLATVAKATEGNRNSALNWAAHKLIIAYRNGRMTGAELKTNLESVSELATSKGLRESEVLRTIGSAMKAGNR
jgi:Bifunctional DNA primase/polymerase, N-terminal